MLHSSDKKAVTEWAPASEPRPGTVGGLAQRALVLALCHDRAPLCTKEAGLGLLQWSLSLCACSQLPRVGERESGAHKEGRYFWSGMEVRRDLWRLIVYEVTLEDSVRWSSSMAFSPALSRAELLAHFPIHRSLHCPLREHRSP